MNICLICMIYWLSLLQDETNAVKKYRGIHFGKMTASRVKAQKGKLYPNPLNIESFYFFIFGRGSSITVFVKLFVAT